MSKPSFNEALRFWLKPGFIIFWGPAGQIALAAFVSIFFLKIPFPLIILAAILVGIIRYQYFHSKIAPVDHNTENSAQTEINETLQETEYYRLIENPTLSNTIKKCLITFVLWLIPFVLLYLSTEHFHFWNELIVFFTQAAFVTFGGAYAVLPYVAQVSVEKYQWLSELQMIDGLALGETTPGPLIMVLAFVGFMAGYHFGGESLLFGTLGLTVTTYYTFLPGFLFIFAGAPFIERTRQSRSIKEVLATVTASVVGVILNLTIYLGMAVILPASGEWDLMSIGWILISSTAPHRFGINMLLWIVISSLYGLLMFFFI